ERPGDTLLEPPRVAAVPEHVAVVVAFQHQRVEPGQRAHDVRGGGSDVGEHAEPALAVGDHELHRLARVVRHGEGHDLHAADRLALPSVDEHHAHALDDLALGLHGEHGPVGQVHGDVVRGGKVEHTVRMVAVLVGDQHAVDV